MNTIKFDWIYVEKIFTRKMMLKYLRQAVKLFLEGNYEYLDPHVGDACCQIRACKLLVLRENILFLRQLNYSLSINSTLFFSKATKNENILFLFLSFFLTKHRVNDHLGFGKTIDYEGIKTEFFCSKTQSKNIARYFQVFLSRMSCNFILDLSKILNLNYSNFLSRLIRKGDDGRYLLPCFFLSDVIYEYLEKNKVPILVRITYRDNIEKQILLNEDPNNDTNFLQLICISESPSSKHFLIQGIVRNSFKSIFYANQAAHSQYCGSNLRVYRENPFFDLNEYSEFKFGLQESYSLHKSRAKKIGCCIDNYSLFLISHINVVTSCFEKNKIKIRCDKEVLQLSIPDLLKEVL